MPGDLLGRLGEVLQRRWPWPELPTRLSTARLVEIRNQRRSETRRDSEKPTFVNVAAPPRGASVRQERSRDGCPSAHEVPPATMLSLSTATGGSHVKA